MATTLLTITDMPGPYDVDGAAIVWNAGDSVNNNHFPSTGKEIVLVRNDEAGAQTVTIVSQPDPQSRTGDISADSIAAGAYAVYQQFPTMGWKGSGGNIEIQPSDPAVMIAVLRLP
jgi:hypothetical protein